MPHWKVDIHRLQLALETVQHYRRISARAMAREIGVSASTLTRVLKDGNRPDVDAFASIIAWLRADPMQFIVRSDGSEPEDDGRVLVGRHDALIAWSWAREALAALPEHLLPPKESRGNVIVALQRLQEEVGSLPGGEEYPGGASGGREGAYEFRPLRSPAGG